MTSTSASSTTAERFGADPDRLARFVDRGRRHRADLADIRRRVLVARRRVVEAVGEGPEGSRAPTLLDLVEAVDDTNAFVESVWRDLLEVAVEGVDPALRDAVLTGRLEPPDDELRRRVLDALLAGLGPDEAGVDAAYFPAAVVRHRDLSRRIEEAEAERSRADGLPLVWWDGDRAEVDAIDRRLDVLLAERDALADQGIDADGTIGPFDAVALVAEASGGSAWEGRRYASAFATHRVSGLAAGGPFGLGAGALADVDGFAEEFDHLAERVAAEPEVAVAFYRELGPQATADLPTFVIGADRSAAVDGDDRTLARLSEGLAAASRSNDAEGRPRLGFGGRDLLEQPRPPTHAGVIGYTPALLFTSGRFEPGFLADATVAALRLGNSGDSRGHIGHWGWEMSPAVIGSTRFTYDGGEDPRNILLGRAAEHRRTVRAVIDGLAAVAGGPTAARFGGPPDGPGPSAFDALIDPAIPFDPMAGTDGPDGRHWLDRLRQRGNREGPDHGLSPLAYPDLPDPYPITGFLGVAAADDRRSRWLLRAVADRATSAAERGDGADESVLGDPGVAAGFDLILGANAALMLDADQLASVGIEGTGLNEDTNRPVGPVHWRSVVGEVGRWGRGQALAAATAELLTKAVAGAIDADGHLEITRTRPFAHLAGRADAEANHAVLAYAASLDGQARARNRQANRTAAVTAMTLGLVPGAGVVAAPIGVGWAWFFDGYPTDAEVEEHRRLWADVSEGANDLRWEQAVTDIWLDRRLGSASSVEIELAVPDVGVGPVAVRRSEESGRFDWRHPVTGRWQRLPDLGENRGLDLFPAEPPTPLRLAISAALDIDKAVEDGRQSRRPSDRRRPDDDSGDWTGRWFGRP